MYKVQARLYLCNASENTYKKLTHLVNEQFDTKILHLDQQMIHIYVTHPYCRKHTLGKYTDCFRNLRHEWPHGHKVVVTVYTVQQRGHSHWMNDWVDDWTNGYVYGYMDGFITVWLAYTLNEWMNE